MVIVCVSNSPVFCFPTFSVVSVNVKAGERRSQDCVRPTDFSCPFYFTTPGPQSTMLSLHLDICNCFMCVYQDSLSSYQTGRSEHKVLPQFGLQTTYN